MHVEFGTQDTGTEKIPTAEIVCTNTFVIAFRNVTSLMVSNISMTNCGASSPTPFDDSFYDLKNNYSLLISHSFNVSINGFTIANGGGVILRLYDNVYRNLIHTTTIHRLNISSNRGSYGLYVRGDSTAGNVSIFNSYFNGIGMKISLLGTQRGSLPIMNSVHIKNSVIQNSKQTSLDLECDTKVILEDTRIANSMGYMVNLQFITILVIQGKCIFQNNGGSFLIFQDSEVIFSANSEVKFVNNNIKCIQDGYDSYCSTLYSLGYVYFHKYAHISFVNNTAVQSGGIYLRDGILEFEGNSSILFKENTGTNGGAMYFVGVEVSLHSNERIGIPVITFQENKALDKGGAIYYETNICHLREFLINNPIKLSFHFINNRAADAGSAIYGSVCSLIFYPDQNPLIGYDPAYIYIEGDNNDYSILSSDPLRVCMCTNSVPNCNNTDYRAEVYPGQVAEIEVVAVGLKFGTVSSTVQAEYDRPGYSWKTIGGGKYLQHVHTTCTALNYETVIDSLQMAKLMLTVSIQNVEVRHWLRRHKDKNLIAQDLVISFDVKNCSLGFEFIEEQNKCKCQKTLTDHSIHCNMRTLNEVYRVVPKWVNATFEHNKPDTDHGVIVHDHCPFDYCRSDTPELPLNLENPEHQCAFNRSGTLCGACQMNLSHVFGTSKCKHCSSLWVLLYIPVLALAGFALVQILTVLDLTVSIGTVNGLIFYANIVRANQAIFFSPQTTNSFFGIFIAWLNLDIGIETCFYGGLDAYIKTWLQFVFPLYIWLIVIIIIILSRHYTAIARISGTNAVQVLATLFLLSYAKLLRNIITVFQPTTLVYPDGYHRRVWLYDGNVDYLKGKHIPLFIAALLLLTLLSIPYTTILLTIQWLQKRNQYRVLFWVRKLKPLFDAYTGPYKENYRYWTGLLLLIRVLLFLVFSLNIANNPSVNLLAINAAIFLILTHLSLVGGVYESRLANVIEVSFLLNVGLLSAATFYQVNTSGNQKQITYTSTGLAFVSFVAIVIYHISKGLLETRRGSKFKRIVESKLKENIVDRVTEIAIPSPVAPQVTHSSIELREALLVS